jgi:hypothetical protein
MPLVIVTKWNDELVLCRTFTLDGQLFARVWPFNIGNAQCHRDGTTRGCSGLTKRWKPANRFARRWTDQPLATAKEMADASKIGWTR